MCKPQILQASDRLQTFTLHSLSSYVWPLLPALFPSCRTLATCVFAKTIILDAECSLLAISPRLLCFRYCEKTCRDSRLFCWCAICSQERCDTSCKRAPWKCDKNECNGFDRSRGARKACVGAWLSKNTPSILYHARKTVLPFNGLTFVKVGVLSCKSLGPMTSILDTPEQQVSLRSEAKRKLLRVMQRELHRCVAFFLMNGSRNRSRQDGFLEWDFV